MAALRLAMPPVWDYRFPYPSELCRRDPVSEDRSDVTRPQSQFRASVEAALQDEELRAALYNATSAKQEAHRTGIGQLHNPDGLRRLAANIKQHALDHLDQYLDQFTRNCENNGTKVHYAATGAEACALVRRIAREQNSKLCVKAKSMTTEEIDLTSALEELGVQVVETDLGEFIVQIDHDRPSHIVSPIIHKNRRVIAEAFARELGVEYTEDPHELTQHARRHLRDIFRRCDLGVTGVNFAIAETGTICLCTNEGNGRLTLTRPKVVIALMGIEKILPRLADLSVVLKLLARSGTGQPLTCYTSLVTGPRRADDEDGPDQLHVIILDNGRSDILNSPYRSILRCLRCGACLNACPVFGKIGGHAYHSAYPGPVGKVLTPLLGNLAERADLPQASSLCGLCREVCPVQIDIPDLLVRLRRAQVEQRIVSRWHRWAFRGAMLALRSPTLYRLTQWFARFVLHPEAGSDWVQRTPKPFGELTRDRDLRVPARRPFRSHLEAQTSKMSNPVTTGRSQRDSHPVRQRVRQAVARTPEPERTPLPSLDPTVIRQPTDETDLVQLYRRRAQAVGLETSVTRESKLIQHLRPLLQALEVNSVSLEPALPWHDSLAAELPPAVKLLSLVNGDATMYTVDAGITGVSAAVAEPGSFVCPADPTSGVHSV